MTAPTWVSEEDEIVQKLGEKHKRWAELGAMYGPGGHYNDQRKRLVAVRAIWIRENTPEKMSEALVDQKAHADATYGVFLDKALKERIEFLELDAEREVLWMRAKLIQARGYEQRRMG